MTAERGHIHASFSPRCVARTSPGPRRAGIFEAADRAVGGIEIWRARRSAEKWTWHLRRWLLAVAASALIPAYASPAGIHKTVAYSDLPGWRDDRHAEAWPALLRGCRVLRAASPDWTEICADAERMPNPTDSQARRFFEQRFAPHSVGGDNPRDRALVTGYYEPLLSGSRTPDERHRYPIFGRPDTLIKVDLDTVHPELEGKRVRGRVVDGRLVPFFTRREINGPDNPLAGHEILWTDDRDALFFLHVQGSGRVHLSDGSVVGIGYADHNGHRYVSIGRRLIEMGELVRDEVTLFSILDWLRSHPSRAEALLNENPGYVFFELRHADAEGPVGSMNAPLTPQRSAAVDPRILPLGTPLWLSTRLPDSANSPYRRLIFAQDTGAAIKGAMRIDLFWGHGAEAERMAGTMKQPGSIYALLPKTAGN